MTTPPPNDVALRFWREWQDSLPADSPYRKPPPAEVDAYGDNPALADELGLLIFDGLKTATCSLVWEYEWEGSAIPEVGRLDIVVDGAGRPLCITEVIEITIRRYCDVDAAFAFEEGEGDRTLTNWREGHWRFFTRICANIGRTPDPAMPLVCQRFRVLHRAPTR